MAKDTFQQLQRVIVDILGVDPTLVSNEAQLGADLGAGSLEMSELTMKIEDAFGIEIPYESEKRIVTVADALSLIEELQQDKARSAPTITERTDTRQSHRKSVSDLLNDSTRLKFTYDPSGKGWMKLYDSIQSLPYRFGWIVLDLSNRAELQFRFVVQRNYNDARFILDIWGKYLGKQKFRIYFTRNSKDPTSFKDAARLQQAIVEMLKGIGTIERSASANRRPVTATPRTRLFDKLEVKMKFLRSLFSKPSRGDAPKQTETPATSPVASPASDQTIQGTEMAKKITALSAQAKTEGWNLCGSVAIRCTNCDAPTYVGIWSSESGELCYSAEDRMWRLSSPLECHKCKATAFRITITKRTFKDVIKQAIDNLPPSEDDPASGFREVEYVSDSTGSRQVETGRLWDGHGFSPALTFNEVWAKVSPFMDEDSGYNPHLIMNNYSDGRVDVSFKTIIAVHHHNGKRRCWVTIFKDKNGKYWSHVEVRR